MMRVRVGYEFGIRVPQDMPLILMVTPEETRHRDFVAPEQIVTDPTVPLRRFRDRFGNICQRLVAPAGDFTLGAHVTLRDHGEWDEVDPDAREMPVEDLPDEVMTFLAASRYVESDVMAPEAWRLFGHQRRLGRLLIARGPDAADVPMLSSFGPHELTRFQVWCHPVDDEGRELPGMDFAPQPG